MSKNNTDRQSRNLLDSLFKEVRAFRYAKEVRDLFAYCIKMRHLSAYNAALVYSQQPGTQLVLSASQWYKEKRLIKPNSRPLIILLPFGPVGFVYDIINTMPFDDSDSEKARQILIDRYINNPFLTQHRDMFGYSDTLSVLKANLSEHGIAYEKMVAGSSISASICPFNKASITISLGRFGYMKYHSYFWVGINDNLDNAEQIAGLCHELGHLFCHHVKAPIGWYTHRPIKQVSEEFEAESTAYLVCKRLGIQTRSVEYLAGYKDDDEIPPVSFENIFRAVNVIETMLSRSLTYKDGYLYKFDKTFKQLADDLVKQAKNRH